MDKMEKILRILKDVTDIEVDDYDANLFGQKYNMDPVEMTSFILKLEEEFSFKITDSFIRNISETTISNIASNIEIMQELHT